MSMVNIIKNKKKIITVGNGVCGVVATKVVAHNLKNPLFKQEHKTKMREQAKLHKSLK